MPTYTCIHSMYAFKSMKYRKIKNCFRYFIFFILLSRILLHTTTLIYNTTNFTIIVFLLVNRFKNLISAYWESFNQYTRMPKNVLVF